jgi:hypothetical protein
LTVKAIAGRTPRPDEIIPIFPHLGRPDPLVGPFVIIWLESPKSTEIQYRQRLPLNHGPLARPELCITTLVVSPETLLRHPHTWQPCPVASARSDS